MKRPIQEATIVRDLESHSASMPKVIHRIVDGIENGSKEYNTVYRQASTNLLVAAGILLAFYSQFIIQLINSSFAIRIIATGTTIFLTLSIAFGIIQQLMEANFFRKAAVSKIKLAEKIITEKLNNADKLSGMLDEMSNRDGYAVKRWASIVQLAVLGVALLLIVITTIYYLFT